MSFYLKQKYWVSIFTILVSCGTTFAQIGSVSNQNYFKNFLSTVSVGGYYRHFTYVRNMKESYNVGNPETKTISAATDPIYFDPMLSLYIGANPSPSSSIGMDLNIINFMNGPVLNSGGLVNNFNAMVLRGNFELKNVGKFNVIFGGIEFTRITPFTFGGNTAYNRYSVFDRRPWDAGGNVKSKYADYYYKGSFNQDARFGTAAFKGLILSGYFAKKVNLDFFYGKAATIGGSAITDVSRPKHDVAGKISKGVGKGNWITLSTYNTIIQYDSVNSANPRVPQMVNVVTASEDFTILGGVNILSEFGIGGYQSPTFDRKWSPAFITDISIPKSITKIPLMFRFYHIGKNYVNRNSYVNNTTIAEANQVYGQENVIVGANGAVLLPVSNQLIGVGSLTNNRMGGNINTELDLGPFKVQLGNEMAVDIDRIPENTTLSYIHRINSLQWSRFAQFPNPWGNFGPNQRVNSIYRQVYEVAEITDTNSTGSLRQKLAHNSADVQLKFHNKIAGRDFYAYWLNTVSSMGTTISPVPVMSNKAYLNALQSELEMYYTVHRLVTLTVYLGYEHTKGNQYTKASSLSTAQLAANPSQETINASMKLRNQIGTAVGTGFDFQVNNSTNLYFRYRWFSYSDKSNAAEKFKGQEGTVELKVFF